MTYHISKILQSYPVGPISIHNMSTGTDLDPYAKILHISRDLNELLTPDAWFFDNKTFCFRFRDHESYDLVRLLYAA